MDKLYACKNAVNNTKVIWKYMEALSPLNDATTDHWEEKTIFISVVEAKIVTPIVKHI